MKRMKTASLYLVITIIATTAFVGCKKTGNPDAVNSPTAAAFFDAKQPAPQVFNFNTADLPKAFTLKDGTVLTIPAGAFTIGGTVANGPAVLEATAFSKKGNMMLAGLNTTSNGQLLESQGSFKLAQRVNGLAVDENLATGKFIKFEVPAVAGGSAFTQLFRGVVADTGAAKNQLIGQGKMCPIKAIALYLLAENSLSIGASSAGSIAMCSTVRLQI